MFHPRIQCDRVPLYLKGETSIWNPPTREPVRLEQQTVAVSSEKEETPKPKASCKIESMLPWYISGGILLAILLFSLLESMANARRLKRIETSLDALLRKNGLVRLY